MTGSNRRPTPCKGAALPTDLITPPENYKPGLFKASFNALPGRNLGTLASSILIASPVRGLRPVRAARLPTAKVPNPTRETEPPFTSVILTASIIDSSARVAAALEMSASFAICSISSVLFTKTPCLLAPLHKNYYRKTQPNSYNCCERLKLQGRPVSMAHLPITTVRRRILMAISGFSGRGHEFLATPSASSKPWTRP